MSVSIFVHAVDSIPCPAIVHSFDFAEACRAAKYFSRENADDIVQNAYLKFREKKGEFTTRACVRFAFLSLRRANNCSCRKRTFREDSLPHCDHPELSRDKPSNVEWREHDSPTDDEELMFATMFDGLDEDSQFVARCLYNGLSQSDIAEIWGTNKMTISRIVAKLRAHFVSQSN